MESGAKGCEVVVSGKLRGQRAKSMKFVDGLMIHAGYPTTDYINSAVTHVHLRQGIYMLHQSLQSLAMLMEMTGQLNTGAYERREVHKLLLKLI